MNLATPGFNPDKSIAFPDGAASRSSDDSMVMTDGDDVSSLASFNHYFQKHFEEGPTGEDKL